MTLNCAPSEALIHHVLPCVTFHVPVAGGGNGVGATVVTSAIVVAPVVSSSRLVVPSVVWCTSVVLGCTVVGWGLGVLVSPAVEAGASVVLGTVVTGTGVVV